GKTPEEAETALAKRARRFATVPVVFTAKGERWSLTPRELETRVDWASAVDSAQAQGNWPLPFRGLKRAWLRLAGSSVKPETDVFDARLDYEVEKMAAALDQPGRNAAIILQELTPVVVPEREGRTLDRAAAKRLIVDALAGFDRRSVPLPVEVADPSVTAEELAPVVEQARTALSAPVRFGWKDAHWLVQPEQLATLLELPARGRSKLRIAGPEADRYFKQLARALDRKAKAAQFRVEEDRRIRIIPSAQGRALDAQASGAALLAGALSTETREAELVVRTVEPTLTTEKARALEVTRVLSSYSTPYSGSYDRIRNLQRAAAFIDGTLLAPGKTFSFNDVVGPRTGERGFFLAPAIIEGEYEDQIGGGVSQVATTIFNAAWEAGVKITARSAHSLYISRYPLGRDATVNYPDVNLKFMNDTDNWMVVRAIAGDSAITIMLLGAPTNRRVESETGELKDTGPPEVERVPDPTLFVGQTVVVDEGEPSRAVSVRRVVYEGDKILYEETWWTSYRSEPKIVRVGTIPRDDPAPPPPGDETTTSTGVTTTTPTSGTTTGPGGG
ncbi:MAG: VanW family protein, partial [Actinobacteria bacterium]|nr:VanW family protein [Actinomycetota bacterium]